MSNQYERKREAQELASRLMFRDEMLESNRLNDQPNTPAGEMVSFIAFGDLGIAAYKDEEGWRVVHTQDFSDALGRVFETTQAAVHALMAETETQARFGESL